MAWLGFLLAVFLFFDEEVFLFFVCGRRFFRRPIFFLWEASFVAKASFYEMVGFASLYEMDGFMWVAFFQAEWAFMRGDGVLTGWDMSGGRWPYIMIVMSDAGPGGFYLYLYPPPTTHRRGAAASPARIPH